MHRTVRTFFQKRQLAVHRIESTRVFFYMTCLSFIVQDRLISKIVGRVNEWIGKYWQPLRLQILANEKVGASVASAAPMMVMAPKQRCCDSHFLKWTHWDFCLRTPQGSSTNGCTSCRAPRMAKRAKIYDEDMIPDTTIHKRWTSDRCQHLSTVIQIKWHQIDLGSSWVLGHLGSIIIMVNCIQFCILPHLRLQWWLLAQLPHQWRSPPLPWPRAHRGKRRMKRWRDDSNMFRMRHIRNTFETHQKHIWPRAATHVP